MAYVLQLAHVARERKALQDCQGGFRNPLDFDAELMGADLQKMARQRCDVFAPLAQRRKAQADHVEAVKQVLAEQTKLDALLQILVGRGDHTHIGLDRAVPAHAVKTAVAEYA